METQTLKRVYYQDADVTVSVEVANNMAFLHVDVSTWNHSKLKKFYRIFAQLEKDCTDAGLIRMATLSPNPKFAHLFGGTTTSKFKHENKEYEVVVWELN